MAKYKYMWLAVFEDGKIIRQHPEDLYSKHDPKAEHNPTSFKDYLDYCEGHTPSEFVIYNEGEKEYGVLFDIKGGHPAIYSRKIYAGDYGIIIRPPEVIYREPEKLKNIRVIYYRSMEAPITDGVMGEPVCKGFVIGYQGIDADGNNRQKTITVI